MISGSTDDGSSYRIDKNPKVGTQLDRPLNGKPGLGQQPQPILSGVLVMHGEQAQAPSSSFCQLVSRQTAGAGVQIRLQRGANPVME